MADRPYPEPCPFCGHVGLDFTEGSTFRWIVASCSGCGASRGETRIQTLGQGTKEEWMADAQDDAIREWNRRAAPGGEVNERLIEALRPFANYACSPSGQCDCHNCRAFAAIADAERQKP